MYTHFPKTHRREQELDSKLGELGATEQSVKTTNTGILLPHYTDKHVAKQLLAAIVEHIFSHVPGHQMNVIVVCQS